MLNKSPDIDAEIASELDSPSMKAYSQRPYDSAISNVPQYVSGLNTL